MQCIEHSGRKSSMPSFHAKNPEVHNIISLSYMSMSAWAVPMYGTWRD